jgi:hypothetical protein
MLIIAVVFMIVRRWWRAMGRKQSHQDFIAAEAFAKQGRAKEACWKYGLSLYRSPLYAAEAKPKIQRLWEESGPFTFDLEFIAEVEGLPPETNEHMLYAFYEGVMKEIEKFVDVAAGDASIVEEGS